MPSIGVRPFTITATSKELPTTWAFVTTHPSSLKTNPEPVPASEIIWTTAGFILNMTSDRVGVAVGLGVKVGRGVEVALGNGLLVGVGIGVDVGVGREVEVGSGVTVLDGVGVSAGCLAEIASTVSRTRTATVASASTSGATVATGSAAATAAWTVASMLG